MLMAVQRVSNQDRYKKAKWMVLAIQGISRAKALHKLIANFTHGVVNQKDSDVKNYFEGARICLGLG